MGRPDIGVCITFKGDQRSKLASPQVSTECGNIQDIDPEAPLADFTLPRDLQALVNFDYNEPVVFIKAPELVQKLGLGGALKPEAEDGAQDEWLALEWMPRDMIDHTDPGS